MSTKDVSKVINKITSLDREKRILVVASNPNNNLKLAIRNLPNVQLSYSNSVNLRDLLLSKEILITESALRHFSLQTQ